VGWSVAWLVGDRLVEVQRVGLALFELMSYEMRLVEIVLSGLVLVVLVVRLKGSGQVDAAEVPPVCKTFQSP